MQYVIYIYFFRKNNKLCTKRRYQSHLCNMFHCLSQLSQDPWTLEPNKSNDLRKRPERVARNFLTMDILEPQDLQYVMDRSWRMLSRDLS